MPENAIARCPCGASLGKHSQPGLPGSGAVERCIKCISRDRVKMILDNLPDAGSDDFDVLTDFEQEFLPSVRRQVASGREISEKQIDVLERMWARL